MRIVKKYVRVNITVWRVITRKWANNFKVEMYLLQRG